MSKHKEGSGTVLGMGGEETGLSLLEILQESHAKARVLSQSECGIHPCVVQTGDRGCRARARGWKRAGCGTDACTAVCRPNAGSRRVVQKRDRGAVHELEGLTPTPPCVVQTWDRGAVRELELEGGERAGCGTDARAAVCRPNAGSRSCRPNAGSGYRARARGLERAGCRTDAHAAVCRPNAGLRCVSSKRGIGGAVRELELEGGVAWHRAFGLY
ncbi:hypothetical protein B0H14DRAFT_2569249 [Mycena olivaceomarginata]|nr:hypothetical protein B0H14DRAFT_2569249 [Mycena olivaceomarginata]